MPTTLLNSDNNLSTLIEIDLGPPLKRSGRWLFWRCPFHSDDRSPSLGVTCDNDRYYCFSCRASGNSISWLMSFRGMGFPEASEIVTHGHHSKNGSQLPGSAYQREVTQQPAHLQDIWKAIIETCEEKLWQPVGARARDYLHRRGLTEKTIQSPFFRLGYSPGLRINKAWVERGIVIPCFLTDHDLGIDQVFYIKIRRPAGDPKYRKLPGYGSKLSGLYNAGWLRGANVIFLTEGEFDCLLLHQEAGDMVGVATVGSSSEKMDFQYFGSYLLSAQYVFVAYDQDDAGNRGANYWRDLSDRVCPVEIPEGKDITEFWQKGGNLSAWVLNVLREHNVV